MKSVLVRSALPIVFLITTLSFAAGCDKSDPAGEAAASPAASSEAVVAGPPTPPPATPGAPTGDVTAVPDTTTIDSKKVTLQKTASGLRYYDTKVGTGATPKDEQTVTVNYVGTFLDGTKFDASGDHGGAFDFQLGGPVIKGWNEGVATMKVGGKRRLVVPGDLAYGPEGRGAIPPNATLVFDIELIGVK